MAQPKKLTLKQKQAKALDEQISHYLCELARLKKVQDLDTKRWAALEIFKELGQLGKDVRVSHAQDIALYVAREAQIGINFM